MFNTPIATRQNKFESRAETRRPERVPGRYAWSRRWPRPPPWA